mmetsp:Transcript_4720/g.10624  ORF Transcript_4720/g.10624 Transcript_4720/m.10624 type:complete len:212 (+) Transcript_4720:46-681(+)
MQLQQHNQCLVACLQSLLSAHVPRCDKHADPWQHGELESPRLLDRLNYKYQNQIRHCHTQRSGDIRQLVHCSSVLVADGHLQQDQGHDGVYSGKVGDGGEPIGSAWQVLQVRNISHQSDCTTVQASGELYNGSRCVQAERDCRWISRQECCMRQVFMGISEATAFNDPLQRVSQTRIVLGVQSASHQSKEGGRESSLAVTVVSCELSSEQT